MTDKKKRKSGGLTYNIVVDSETGEIEEDYYWREDHEQPPLIKPKKRPDNDSKRRSRKN